MSDKNRTPLIIGIVVVAVIAALGLAFLVTGDDSSDDAAPSTEASGSGSDDGAGEGASGEAAGETFPVTVTGDALPEYSGANPDPAAGQAAPLVEGSTFDGTAASIGGPTDGPTMYVFLAHWCPHCNDEIPELIELQESGQLPADLNVVGISTAVTEGQDNYPPSTWIDEKGWPWPVMADSADSEAFLAWGGAGFPYTVMVDPDGNVLARKAGSASADETIAWINATLS